MEIIDLVKWERRNNGISNTQVKCGNADLLVGYKILLTKKFAGRKVGFMKIPSIIICALLLVGCTSSRQSASLNADQAKAIAMRLANDKAATVYHCQPFRDGQPAHFVAGHWIWTDQQGFGHGDIQASVELATDGSTHRVDLQLMDSTELF